ncbi:MAG: hypothetical protein FJ290_16975 [Planctomycetes bacterium]|nr:hypothetical protein [Planctomycetota bacterium]
MAKLIVTCPNCKKKMAAPEGAERFRCPTCKTVLSAPKEPGGEAAVSMTSTVTFAAPAPPTEVAPAPVAPQKPKTEAGAVIDLSELSERPDGDGELAAGQRLGGYTVQRLIGHGGMGSVYEAVQEGLKRRVAIKVLPEAAARDADFLVNFKREAQAIAKLNHPNIVQIFDIDEERGYHFFSMEYVDGESLASRLAREGRLPVADAVEIVAQVAAALDFACERMILHRGLKPENILFTEQGSLKLADVGLLKSFEGTSVSMVRGAHGGPLYMAPEFAKNPRLADCRSDIYALGAVLFHLLTGRPPFSGATASELILQHAETPFPSARAVAAEVPQGADALMRKMCAKDPAERPQNYQELLDEMQALVSGTAIQLPVTDTGAPTGRKAGRRSRLPLAIGAAAALLAVAGLAAIVLPALRPRRSRATAPTTSTLVEPDKAKAPARPKSATPVLPKAKKGPEVKAKEAITPPKPTTDVSVEPKQKEPEPKKEPKEEPKGEPKGEPKEEPKGAPKEGDGPAWRAKLAEARKNTDALAAENQFGKALAALDELTKANDDADLGKAVAEAKAAIQAQATKAYEAIAKKATDLATKGKLDEAKAALQTVVDTFGTDDEVMRAKEAADAIGQFQETCASLAKGAEDALATARRATQQAEAAKSLEAVHKLAESWNLDGALAELAKLKFEDPGLAAQVAQRKAAIEALAAYRDAIIQHIKAAQPRIRKSDLKVSGNNGDLVDADKKGLTAVVPKPGGGMENDQKLWSELTRDTVERLAKLPGLSRPDDAAQQLALGFWFRLAGDEEKAKATLARAGGLGAETDALSEAPLSAEKAEKEAQAAQAFAELLKLTLDGKRPDLDAYKQKFGKTDAYAAQERLLELAAAFKPYAPPTTVVQVPPEKEPEPKQKAPEPKQKGPVDEKKAKECYDRAAAAFAIRDLEACGKHLDALREASAASPLLTDKKLNPTVEAMQAAVKARGQFLKLGGGAPHASLDKALAAIEKPPASIEVAGGANYTRVAVSIPADKANGLILRGGGERRPILMGGGPKGDPILQFADQGKNAWLGHLEFRSTKAALDLSNGCEVTLHDCFAYLGVETAISKHVQAKASVEGCVLRLDSLKDLTARNSALLLADGATVEGGNVASCVIVGKDIQFRSVTLTDCLILGDGDLRGGVKLTHVTAVSPLTLADDARGATTIADSILHSLVVAPPAAKGKAAKDKKGELLATVTNTAFYEQAKAPANVKAEDPIRLTRPPFEDPRGPRYWLPEGSPLRTKASDKSELGCRFSRDMRALWHALGSRAEDLLKPPSRK